MNEKELLELKKKIDNASKKESELTGEEKQLLKRLKDELGCKNVDEAKEKKSELKKDKKVIDKGIESNINKLEKMLKDEKE